MRRNVTSSSPRNRSMVSSTSPTCSLSSNTTSSWPRLRRTTTPSATGDIRPSSSRSISHTTAPGRTSKRSTWPGRDGSSTMLARTRPNMAGRTSPRRPRRNSAPDASISLALLPCTSASARARTSRSSCSSSVRSLVNLAAASGLTRAMGRYSSGRMICVDSEAPASRCSLSMISALRCFSASSL